MTNDRALRFSERGDQVFSALADKFPGAARWRLMFEQRLDDGRFAQIALAMRMYLSSCLGERRTLDEKELCEQLLARRAELANYTSGAMVAPQREHTIEFNFLHRSVAAAFSDFDLAPHISGIDLPINVRMVYGESDPTRLSAPFASSKLHTDVWAGVPADAAVIVLPILGDIDHIYVACGEMPREQELEAMRAMTDYELGANYQSVVPYSDAKMKLGHLYVADARLLHQTIRARPEGVRVSVDFRFRFDDPGYRAMVPPIEAGGPDSYDSRVPYDEWLRVGSDKIIAFEQTMVEARAKKSLLSSSPVNTATYRLAGLFDDPRRDARRVSIPPTGD